VAGCFRYRVTGLAAEAAFWALLSLPPLALGLIGTLGYLRGVIGADTISDVQTKILHATGAVLSEQGVRKVLVPTLHSVLGNGRPDVISLGFLIALWSGSRALNVYVDTITIAYGMSGRRGIIRTRLLSFALYVSGVMVGVVLLPLVVAGPNLVRSALPAITPLVDALYWPVVVLLSVASLSTLYHVSVPMRTGWLKGLPGAVLALVVWLGGSALLRLYLAHAVTGPSLYGSLAAPVAVLFWLYVTALAVLIGAALNATVEQRWPGTPPPPAPPPARGGQPVELAQRTAAVTLDGATLAGGQPGSRRA
jgi:membrane protein